MALTLHASDDLDTTVSTISKQLSADGTLQNIRAQLRSCVYTALLQSEAGKKPSPPSLSASPESALALALIDDFLRFHRLDNTASTAAAEVIGWEGRTSPTAAAAELKLPDTQSPSAGPLLLQLVAAWRNGVASHAVAGEAGVSTALPSAPTAAAATGLGEGGR